MSQSAAPLRGARLGHPGVSLAVVTGRGVDSIGRSFGWFLVLFFVPALPVRYGLDSGTRYVAALACLVLIGGACALGIQDTFARSPGRPGRWLAQMAVATLAGLAAAVPAEMVTRGYPEARLLGTAAAFFVVTVTVCALLDRAVTAPAR